MFHFSRIQIYTEKNLRGKCGRIHDQPFKNFKRLDKPKINLDQGFFKVLTTRLNCDIERLG